MKNKSKMKLIVILFIILIFIYLLLNIITNKNTNETFCDTETDTVNNEYQEVLNNSQLSQISNMINTQTANIIRSAGNLIPGPRGLQGPQGNTGGIYQSSGYILNNGKVLNNALKMEDKNNSVNQIWYLRTDGKLYNKYFTKDMCLDDKLKTVPCSDAPKWTWDNLGQIKIGDKCLINDSNTAILSNCDGTSSNKSWIIN
tara:strand:- start:2954 stop:3553 length:600 start_codon:yes stop_codon:yes gene_type:complete